MSLKTPSTGRSVAEIEAILDNFLLLQVNEKDGPKTKDVLEELESALVSLKKKKFTAFVENRLDYLPLNELIKLLEALERRRNSASVRASELPSVAGETKANKENQAANSRRTK